jgi:alpha-tubulin suppressor-like RCC1 family protein
MRGAWLALVVAGCGAPVVTISPREARPAADPPAPSVEAPPIEVPRATAIAAGWELACALRSDRTVWCWPATHGPLRAVPVAGVSDVEEISVHENLGCARRSDGHVWCWGSTDEGRRGAGAALQSGPTEVEGIDDAVDVEVGQGAACVLRRSGEVFCWGDQPGYAARVVDRPVRIEGPSGIERIERDTYAEFRAYGADGSMWTWSSQRTPSREAAREARFVVEAGVLRSSIERVPSDLEPLVSVVWDAGRACAVEQDGGVVCFARTNDPARDLRVQRPPFTNATRIALGTASVCALLASGDVECWSESHAEAPARRVVWGVEPSTPPSAPGKVVQVAVGRDHACARHESGAVRCWGADDHGQRGDGAVDRDGSSWVLGLDDATDLAAGRNHACAIRRGGTVVCWGAGEATAIAAPRYDAHAPRVIEGVEDATSLSAHTHQTCAIVNGRVRCWGGHGHERGDAARTSLVEIPDVGDAIAISARERDVAITRRDGRVRVSATQEIGPFPGVRAVVVYGERPLAVCVLADAGLDCGATPTQASAFAMNGGRLCVLRENGVSCGVDRLRRVEGLEGAVSIALGERNGCAVMANGDARCWGSPPLGALRAPWLGEPLGAQGVTEVVALDAGGCVRAAQGTRCWGRLAGAELPAGPLVFSGETYCRVDETGALTCAGEEELPERIPRAPELVSFGHSLYRGCAVVGGVAHCWNGSRAARTLLRDVTAIAVAGNADGEERSEGDACAIIRGGRVQCVAADGRTPWFVEGVERAIEISAGDHAFCARLEDGSVRCWGPAFEGGHPSHGIAGIAGARAVRVGGAYACVVRDDRTVACWGRTDEAGPLGDGLRDVITPRTLPGLADVADLSLGRNHACARFTDGTARCWGERSLRYDTLGDQGDGAPRTVPLP